MKELKKKKNGGGEEEGAKAEEKKEEKSFAETYVVPDIKAKAGFERPVMVHRAMLGSVERMFAVLCEHYGGKWPFWLSPRQVMLVPVHADQFEYGESVRKQLHDIGIYAEVDTSKATFNKKVRNAQVDQWNYQLVVGKEEMANGTVNVRTRANEQKGEMKVADFIEMCKGFMANKSTQE
jgi:threonyl-tRNA synthetase